MNIVIGADIVPTNSNEKYFRNGDIQRLIGNELASCLQEADYRIFNLEVPLTNIECRLPKCGPNLIAPESTINGYCAMGIDALALANNHILDQGERGLSNTCKLLTRKGIKYFGAGNNLREAAEPHIFEVENKRIAIYACAEHEFTIAEEKKEGANPYDPLESFDQIVQIKSQCDYLIVLYHGGKEHYRYPSPNLQRICRKFVDKGANLVLCQHSHAIGCEEKYADGTIVYGQGNFIFDYSDNECWKTGLLVQIGDEYKITYIPFVKQEGLIRAADDKQSKEILTGFFERSQEIKREGFIEEQYNEFAKSVQESYLMNLSGVCNGIVFRVINKLSGYKFGKWLVKGIFSKKTKLAIRNYIECEAHRELLLRGLKNE